MTESIRLEGAAMTSSSKAVMAPSPTPAERPTQAAQPAAAPTPPQKPKWLKYGTPIVVLLLAATVVVTLTWNGKVWEGGRIEQTSEDAYVVGDLTPLITKVAGIVRE